jgi:hypothetical protein
VFRRKVRCNSGWGHSTCFHVEVLLQLVVVVVVVNSYPDPSPKRYAGYHYLILVCIYVHKQLLPDDFGASPRPVAAYMPGVLFSGPVARGFETSVMPLRSPVLHLRFYCLAYQPACLSYLEILLPAYLICY